MARHGENIRKREDGRWEARYIYRPTADGKKVTKSLYGSSYYEAKQRRNAFVEEISRKEAPTPAVHIYPALKDVASFWLNFKMADIKESTATTYLRILNLYILPGLGEERIDCVDSECINNFLSELQQHGRKRRYADSGSKENKTTDKEIMAEEGSDKRIMTEGGTDGGITERGFTGKSIPNEENSDVCTDTEDHVKPADGSRISEGLSAKTVADIKSVLLSILKHAQMLKIITSVPECKNIPHVQPIIEVMTKAEQARLEQLLFNGGKKICLISLLSLYTGIRIGEICGLRWKDIDLVNKTISITQTVLRIANTNEGQNARTKVVVQTPKSHASLRVVPIPDVIIDYLCQWKEDDEIYLASGKETFTEPRLCQYHFEKLLKQAEIRHYKFHTLRHTFATRCIEHGVDVKSLCEIMGHSNVSITMQRYVHPSLDMKREQINKLTKI